MILADFSPIFTFCRGQLIISFIYLSKMLYVILSIGVKGSEIFNVFPKIEQQHLYHKVCT